jgi:hypothetical protein
MLMTEFIDSIRQVSPEAALKMEGYATSRPLNQNLIRHETSASQALQGIMIWAGTSEGSEYWDNINNKLHAWERDKKRGKHSVASGYDYMLSVMEPELALKVMMAKLRSDMPGNTEPKNHSNTEPDEAQP